MQDLHPVTSLSIRRGLWRYRQDRLALLDELGQARQGLALSRFGRIRLYIVTDAALAEEVLLERAADYRKGPALTRFSRPLLGNGLISADGAVHKRHRKILAPGFQARRIARYRDDMVNATVGLLDGWRPGETLDLANEMMLLTVRIAAKTMFGDADVSGEVVGEHLDVANRWVMRAASSPTPLPLWVPTPANRGMRRALRALDDIVYQVIAGKRQRSVADGQDVLDMLMAARDDDGQGLSDQQIRDEVMTFFLAGHETTATALSWLFWAIHASPEVLPPVLEELDTVLAGRLPRLEDLEQLPRLRALIQETLRLYPSVYMIGREAISPTTVGGHALPAGAYVLINVYGLHRRADYHEAPMTFRPERHLGPSTAPRGAYLPFGLGPRVCIGNQFAMMEAGLLSAIILQRMRAPHINANVTAEPLITLRPSTMPFVVTPR